MSMNCNMVETSGSYQHGNIDRLVGASIQSLVSKELLKRNVYFSSLMNRINDLK